MMYVLAINYCRKYHSAQFVVYENRFSIIIHGIQSRTTSKHRYMSKRINAKHFLLSVFVVFFLFLVPPQKPKILNERAEMIQALAGPYDEGSDMVLLCEVRGGSPPPKIQWFLNGKPHESSMLDFSFVGTQTSKLVIKNLSRFHQHSILTCRASNFPKTEITSNVTIDLLCKYKNHC